MHDSTEILERTFARLEELYSSEGLRPGKFIAAGLKPGWNVVIGSDGQCGMAMGFTDPGGAFGKPEMDIERLGSCSGKDLFEVADYYIARSGWHERSIGVASLSALSQPFLTAEMLAKRGYTDLGSAVDLTSFVKPEDIVTVIGYGGSIKRLLGRCRELHVTDLRPRAAFQTLLVGETIAYTPAEVIVHPETENREAIGRADIVWITGSSLVNGTFGELTGYAASARMVGMYGASASLLPDALFDAGVSFIHSYRVSDPASFEWGARNDTHMEQIMKTTQQQYVIQRQPR